MKAAERFPSVPGLRETLDDAPDGLGHKRPSAAPAADEKHALFHRLSVHSQ